MIKGIMQIGVFGFCLMIVVPSRAAAEEKAVEDIAITETIIGCIYGTGEGMQRFIKIFNNLGGRNRGYLGLERRRSSPDGRYDANCFTLLYDVESVERNGWGVPLDYDRANPKKELVVIESTITCRSIDPAERFVRNIGFASDSYTRNYEQSFELNGGDAGGLAWSQAKLRTVLTQAMFFRLIAAEARQYALE